MPTISYRFRVRRRVAGDPGPPLESLSSEIFFNEIDNSFWIGKGNDGDDNATSFYQINGFPTGAVDVSGTPVATNYARFTDANTLEGRTPAQVRADLGLGEGFSAHKNGTDQTAITLSTYVKVTFGSEVFDVGARFGSSTYTPVAGLVTISASLQFTTNVLVGDVLILAIYKNALLFKQVVSVANQAGICHLHITISDSANGTDTYEVYAFAGGASAKTIDGLSQNTWFMGRAA